MKNYLSLLFVLLLLVSCTGRKVIENTMFPGDNYLSINDKVVKLSSLFGEYRLIRLETNDSCLISENWRNKILKSDSLYYVLSTDAVLCFDLAGHYVRRIEHKGSGPNEYPEIFDFDIILSSNKNKELWISTAGGIIIYDATTGDYLKKIKMNQFVSQFKYVDENTILTVVPEDTVFQVWDLQGNVRKKFMKKDFANSIVEPHQFFTYQGNIVYHWGGTQSGIVYDPENDECSLQSILQPQTNVLTPDVNREYYEKYGQKNHQKELLKDNYTISSTIRVLKDQGIMTWIAPGFRFLMTTITPKGYQTFDYSDNSKVINDLLSTNDNSFLARILGCDSDDSFLFVIPAEIIQEKGVNEDDNPWLLDVKKINYVN